ncbi:hypothetical protein PT2222_120119 [Paraburkholderia tropica]
MSMKTEITNKQINKTAVMPNIFILHHPPLLVSIFMRELYPLASHMHNLKADRKNMRKR